MLTRMTDLTSLTWYQEVWDLKQKCGHVSNIYVDAANPEVVQALKQEFEERV